MRLAAEKLAVADFVIRNTRVRFKWTLIDYTTCYNISKIGYSGLLYDKTVNFHLSDPCTKAYQLLRYSR